MTSKTIALTILDWIFMSATMLMLLVVAGCPVGWLLRITEMSLREFEWFSLFIVFSTLGLIHAIATSDSAP